MRQWRLIYDCPIDGADNMAVDEAILTAVGAGRVLPTLRFYAWESPCITLGYGQPASDVDFDRTKSYGWEVIRRLSGGQAVLNTHELTYSLALPQGHEFAVGDLLDSYQRISAALLVGLNKLGLSPEAERQAERHVRGGPVCFETISHYEITVGGRKLVGNSQVRRHKGVLQHGSLPLSGDVARVCDALVYPDETSRAAAKAQVRTRAITLAEAMGYELTWQAVAEMLTAGFATLYEIDFVSSGLSADEAAQARQLAAEVYGSDRWTLRR